MNELRITPSDPGTNAAPFLLLKRADRHMIGGNRAYNSSGSYHMKTKLLWCNFLLRLDNFMCPEKPPIFLSRKADLIFYPFPYHIIYQ